LKVDHITIVKSHREDVLKAEKELETQLANHEIQVKQINDSNKEKTKNLNDKITQVEESKAFELDKLQTKFDVKIQTVNDNSLL
jgi:hypothetical protein